jgi:hypothetical protein
VYVRVYVRFKKGAVRLENLATFTITIRNESN